MKVFFKKYNVFIIFLIFIVVLLTYSIFSSNASFTGTREYINLAKEFAGLNRANFYVFHSVGYGLFLSLFLRMLPYLLTLKIISALFLILDAYLLYKLTNNKKVLWLWIFSPLVFYINILLISPILATSTCLLLSYYFLKKYEGENKKIYFIISALSLGLMGIFRIPALAIIVLFMVIFFYKKTFKEFFYYSILVLVVISIRFLIDYLIFGVPFYSMAIFLTFVGSQNYISFSLPKFLSWYWLASLIIISPFTLLIYKTKSKKELLFVIITYLYLSMIADYRLLLVIAPFVIILLAKILNKKLIMASSFISIFLILLLTFNSFGNNENNILKDDLISIEKDFRGKVIVVSDSNACMFPALYWNDFNYVWLRDYTLHKQNKTAYQEYVISSNPTIKASKTVEISINLNQIKDKALETTEEKDLLFVFEKEEFEYNENKNLLTIFWKEGIEYTKLFDMKLVKCYDIICVFKKLNYEEEPYENSLVVYYRLEGGKR